MKFFAGLIVLCFAGHYLSNMGQCGANYNWTCGTMWWLLACIAYCGGAAYLSARKLVRLSALDQSSAMHRPTTSSGE